MINLILSKKWEILKKQGNKNGQRKVYLGQNEATL